MKLYSYCKWLHHQVENILQTVFITNCLIQNTTNFTDILMFTESDYNNIKAISMVYIDNTNFIYNTCNSEHSTSLVNSDNTVSLSGPHIVIHGNTFQSLFTINNGYVIVHNDTYIEVSENKATYMIQNRAVTLFQDITITIRKNVISYLLAANKVQNVHIHIPICYFQLFGNQKRTTNKIIIADSNLVTSIFKNDAENINCHNCPINTIHFRCINS